ncbi:50S ribosomal protein L19e [uncultured archaeon]|nr:50S ribosomal protein L19e [uncultured archaeon]
MDLSKKKELASRALGVGKGRIVFVGSRKDEIKEAITKQDIRELVKNGSVIIKDSKGRRKKERKSSRLKRKTPGKIRLKVNTRKRDYMILTRKLRKYIYALKSEGKIDGERFKELRKKIRNKEFKSKANLKYYIEELSK